MSHAVRQSTSSGGVEKAYRPRTICNKLKKTVYKNMSESVEIPKLTSWQEEANVRIIPNAFGHFIKDVSVW